MYRLAEGRSWSRLAVKRRHVGEALARVAGMEDAPGLEPGIRKGVGVRIPPWALGLALYHNGQNPKESNRPAGQSRRKSC